MKRIESFPNNFITFFKGKNKAQIVQPEQGGIDFTADKTPLEISAKDGPASGWKFNIDPAMLAQFQNAPGFEPVIIHMLPMTDLRVFLQTGLDT